MKKEVLLTLIYNPQDEYDKKYKSLHYENTVKFFNELAEKSGVNQEENERTVLEHDELVKKAKKIRKKIFWLKFLRVLMIITIVLIPLVIIKTTPKIKRLKAQASEFTNNAEKLIELAKKQVAPLNSLFSDKDCINLIESTIEGIKFEPYFSAKQEENMAQNFDFEQDASEHSTLDTLAGHYNQNPFVFETKRIHVMGQETYHGYKTISWTDTYRDSNGRLRTRRRTQTLHATVVKPKPFYREQLVLSYCAQGGPELSFSRDATNLDDKSEKQLDRYVKKGEKRLKKKTDKALQKNVEFVSMSNTDFEVMFDALDRDNEVQFRTLFTPLAQTNMVDLITSKTGYGDDFNFIKKRRTNKIITEHSQKRAVVMNASSYLSHSFEEIKNNFIDKNAEFFKSVYFDFAPIWAIPIYQEEPVHSLDPIPDLAKVYAQKECEAIANLISPENVVHPQTKTPAILKASPLGSSQSIDQVKITAYSYDINEQVDFISVLGGDGRWHSVPVPWQEFIPLTANSQFFVANEELAKDKNIMAKRKNVCIYN